MHDLAKELQQALRALVRAPGFTLVALLSLALGIGATTAIFSVIYGVTVRPLPYASPEHLVSISEQSAQAGDFAARRGLPAALPDRDRAIQGESMG